MRSSLIKHLWLIQPNDHHPPVMPIDAAGGSTLRFCPAWDLLCLHAFIVERTGHTCSLIDTRLFDTLDEAFSEPAEDGFADANVMAVIYTTTAHLGSVGEIVRYIKKTHASMPITLFGPHLTHAPEIIRQLPGVNYGLRGDPELMLRSLLDSIDIPHRQKLVPGLLTPGAEIKDAHWLHELRPLSLPDWQNIHWPDYRHNENTRGAHIEIRMSRGHPGTAVDLAWPDQHEPLRAWPMERIARILQKCPGSGINEVFFADPPGFWSDERIEAWIACLKLNRSSQEWSFQIMARELSDRVISELVLNGCHRIELIIPALDPARQAALGMTLDLPALKRAVAHPRSAGLDAQVVFWIEGPWPAANEAETILGLIRQLGRPSFAVYPFPFHHSAPLYAQAQENGLNPPALEAWVAWAQDSAHHREPVALWTSESGLPRAEAVVNELHRRIARDPWRNLQRWLPGGESGLLARLEERAAAAWRNWFDKISGHTGPA